MGELADNQNAILRALYEEWHAPLDLLEQLTRRVPGGLSVAAEHAGWKKKCAADNLHRKLLNISDTELSLLAGSDEAEASFDPKASEVKIKLLTGAAKLIDVLAVTEGKLAGQGRAFTNAEGTTKTNRVSLSDESSDADKIVDQFYFTPEGEAELNRQISNLVERSP